MPTHKQPRTRLAISIIVFRVKYKALGTSSELLHMGCRSKRRRRKLNFSIDGPKPLEFPTRPQIALDRFCAFTRFALAFNGLINTTYFLVKPMYPNKPRTQALWLATL